VGKWIISTFSNDGLLSGIRLRHCLIILVMTPIPSTISGFSVPSCIDAMMSGKFLPGYGSCRLNSSNNNMPNIQQSEAFVNFRPEKGEFLYEPQRFLSLLPCPFFSNTDSGAILLIKLKGKNNFFLTIGTGLPASNVSKGKKKNDYVLSREMCS